MRHFLKMILLYRKGIHLIQYRRLGGCDAEISGRFWDRNLAGAQDCIDYIHGFVYLNVMYIGILVLCGLRF